MKYMMMLTAALALSSAALGQEVASRKGGGGSSGHGGRVVTCVGEDGRVKHELLDYWLPRNLGSIPAELQEAWRLTIDTGPGKTVQEKIDFLLARVARVEPGRAALMQRRAYRLMEQLRDVENDNGNVRWKNRIINHGDFTMELSDLPRECVRLDVEVLVSQKPAESGNPEENWFDVNRDLWMKLVEANDVETMSGIIAHEVSYQDAIAQGHKSSDGAAYLNAVMASTRVDAITGEEWQSLLAELKIGYLHGTTLIDPKRIVRTEGQVMAGTVASTTDPLLNSILADGASRVYLASGHQVVFYAGSGHVQSGVLGKDFALELGGVRFVARKTTESEVMLEGQQVRLPIPKFVHFHENGLFARGWASTVEGTTEVSVEGTKVDVAPGYIGFDATGKLNAFTARQRFTVEHGGKKLTLGGEILLDEQDRVVSAVAIRRFTLRSTDGQDIRVNEGERVHFDPAGNLASGGVYFKDASERDYIRVTRNGDRIAFARCSLEDASRCVAIGNAEGYDKKLLKKKLKVSAEKNYELFGWKSHERGIAKKAGNVYVALFAAAFFAGEYITKTIGTPAFEALLIGSAGVILLDRLYWLFEDLTEGRRARNHILNQRYLSVDMPLATFQAELEASLAAIR